MALQFAVYFFEEFGFDPLLFGAGEEAVEDHESEKFVAGTRHGR